VPGTATSLRMRLGNEIRAARVAANMTQQEVAKLLNCTQGKINKIETGAVAVKMDDLDAMLTAFQVGNAKSKLMRQLATSGSQRNPWSGDRAAIPSWFRVFTELEPAASEIVGWHGERIHGPLQSEHYMLTQFRAAGKSDYGKLLRNRMERRQIFDLNPPPSQRFILSEAAFRRMPGGPNPGVALDQVQYLIQLAQRYPALSIHVLPFQARVAYVPNDFTIMRFTDGTPNCVFVEHVTGAVKIDDEPQFHQFVQAWEQLLGAALERNRTIEFLHRLAERFRAQLSG
jgi:transcriptional regulator with XRE-family HTH domain